MGFIKCTICDQEFYDNSSVCPNCGPPVNEQCEFQNGLRHCTMCKRKIPDEANICHHCGQHQSLFKRIIFSNIYNPISIGLLFIAIAMLIFSYKENVSAREAIKEAQLAATQAKNARGTSLEVLGVIKNLVEIHNQAAASITLNYSPIADHREELLDKIDKVLKTSDKPPGQ